MRTFEDAICGTRDDVVHLIAHATRLGHEAHRARSIQFAGHDVVQSACCITYPECSSLQVAHLSAMSVLSVGLLI